MKLLMGLVIVGMLTGCASFAETITVERQQDSSGLIGCSPAEIGIVNTGRTTWEATCKGKVFYCTVSSTTMCTAKMEAGAK